MSDYPASPSISTPKKKESPNPLPRAVETGAPVRPLTPMRRLAVPLGIAAALALTTGGAAAYAMSRTHEPEPTYTPTSSHHTGSSVDVSDVFARVKAFLSPEPERPRLAGDVAEPSPPPTPVPSQTAGTPRTPVIVPQEPVRMGGAVAVPTHRPPPSPTPPVSVTR